MKKAARLTGKKNFETVFTDGRTWASSFIAIRALPNGADVSRYSVVAGRRLGKAVVRNRIKRRLREAVRRMPIREGWDVVIIARSVSADTDYRNLEEAVRGLLARAGLLDEGENRE